MSSDRAKLRARVVASLEHRPPVDRAIAWPAEGEPAIIGFAGKAESGDWCSVVRMWLFRHGGIFPPVDECEATAKRFESALRASRLPRGYRVATPAEVREFAWLAYRNYVMEWLDRWSRDRRSDHPSRKVMLHWSREGARLGVYISDPLPELVPLRRSPLMSDRQLYASAPAHLIAVDEYGELYFVAQVPRGRAGAWCARHGLRLYPNFNALFASIDANVCHVWPASFCSILTPWSGSRPPGWPVPLPEPADPVVSDAPVLDGGDSAGDVGEVDDGVPASSTHFLCPSPKWLM